MVEVMTTNMMTGRSAGTVTYRNRCQVLAPSIRAASYRSFGIACIAARKISALYPVQRQLTIVAMARWLAAVSWCQPIGPKTRWPSPVVVQPNGEQTRWVDRVGSE